MSGGGKEKRRPGGLIFALIFLIVALLLLTQLGSQTKFSPKGQLFAQPAFWPAVGVMGMVLFGACHAVVEYRRSSRNPGLGETGVWLRSLEYLIWFMAYVFAVPIIGYLPATLIFALALALRAGYRNRRILVAAALMGLAVVLIFKTILSVKIPGGALYDYLPGALKSVAIINF
ncbi:MAG: tripartite tricarboxylate transporter TctB family protein [Pseudomonadota bacterium]